MNTTTATRKVRKAESGSQLIAALELVWKAIQKRHPDVPDVVMITGSGASMFGLTWGHYGHDFWKNGRFVVDGEGTCWRDTKPELFVSGETLGQGPVKVLQTLLHEASHAVAAVRKIKDTSRQNRYHNSRFLQIARELGCDYPQDKPHQVLGFSSVTIQPQTRERYAKVTDKLGEAIALTMDLPGWANAGISGGGGTDTGHGVTGGRRGTGTGQGSRNLKAVCRCGNIVRASKTMLDKEVIRCDDCGELFTHSSDA